MRRVLQRIYYVIIPVLILGISFGYTSFDVAFVAFLPLLFLTNRHTVGIFLAMYGGPLGGVIRAMYPSLPVYGLLFQLIGFILIRDLIMDLFRNNLRAFGLMALLLAIYGFFYLMGPQSDWATEKYLSMCKNGFMMIACYYAYCHSADLDADRLLQLMFVTAICMFAYVITSSKLTPGHIFDYNWFRYQISMLNREYRDYGGLNTVVFYQHIGMLVAYALAVFISQMEIKKLTTVLYVVCGLQLALMSGCRQAIFAIIIIVAFRLVVLSSKNFQQHMSVNRVVGTIIGVFVSYIAINIFFENIQSDVITQTLAEGDTGRIKQYIDAWNIFMRFPMFGAGIGGYQSITGDAWPHNFFFELLCETGLIGAITIVAIALLFLARKQIVFFYLTESNMFYILVIITLAIRIMVSSDFRESIELFSAIFAITSTTNDDCYITTNSEENVI